ncbi:lycopene cyclase domain-containing protein [Nocardia beijingensis]|uniref:lycopene cyclase domain-containing protein n=1 Tax=Nocardia beijingensis TaxID=95162 RepID=UPI000834185A|nr:lycopene cyclase domain-containing protein [Nocardia beijingensis]
MNAAGWGYTLPVVTAVVVVCLVECTLLRTGLFRRPGYWLTMLIVLSFQIPVDGWLTRLDAPIVRYNPDHVLGLRFPWDIPVEDFLFGFVLVTSVLLAWERARQRQEGVR